MDPKINTLETFGEEIFQLWNAELMLVKKLPSLMDKASHFGLKRSLAMHLAETRQHANMMHAILKTLEIDKPYTLNHSLSAILKEGDQRLENSKGDDKAIIAAAKKVEAFEILSYTSAAVNAEMLGLQLIASRLYYVLEEEQKANYKLSFYNKVLDMDLQIQ